MIIMPILQLGDNVIQGVACHLQYKCSLISVIASTPKTRNLCHKECRPYPVAVSLPCGHKAVLAFFEAMLNRLTPACSATDSDLLDLIYVPINLAVDFKEIAEDSVKTFINST